MLKNIKIILCAVALLICFCNPRVSAQSSIKSGEDSRAEAEELFFCLLENRLSSAGASSVQEFIDGYLCENLSAGSEWYVLALAQSGEYDFGKYGDALSQYLSERRISSQSSAKKYALCLAAIGSTDSYISNVLERELGTQGIMEIVFALHLLNNGYSSSKYTAEELCSKILSSQLEDGGWAVSGEVSDVDVSAMVLQALAARRGDDKTEESISRALALLSRRQLESGGFSSYGKPNAESCAQVIIALSALSIDAGADERFLKGGNSVIDALKSYRLPSGGFSSGAEGEESELATLQSFCAAAAYLRMLDGKGSLYILDHADPANVARADMTEKGENATVAPPDAPTEAKTFPVKLTVCIVIAMIAIMICVLLLILKKRSLKNFLAVAIAAAICIAFVCFTDLKSPEEYYASSSKKSDICGKVTVSIRCDTLIGKAEGIDSEEDAVILAPLELDLARSESAYDILLEAAKKNKIRVEINGTEKNAYVIGIADLYEHDYGDLSGWTYRVNGETCSVGCSQYKLSDGDVIEWIYTCELGQDIG